MEHPKIPSRTKGKSHDVVSMHCCDSVMAARKNYDLLRSRITTINDWHELSDKVKAKFALYDANTGLSIDSLQLGNLVRINVPGIGNPTGDGYDWTEIIDIHHGREGEDYSFFIMTLRPCPAPDSPNDVVAHFYTDESTNSFIIRRLGTCLYAEVHGRNEIENTKDVRLLDTLRNKAVAVGGKIGLGSINWQGFTEALLEPFSES